MSAAIEAVRAGATVTLLEKMPQLGGNSEKASSGMNAARTAVQIKRSIKDSVDDFYKDTIASGRGLANPELVDILTKQSVSAFDFLASFGVELSEVVKLGGHSRARTHHPSQASGRNAGWEITNALSKYMLRFPRDRLNIVPSAQLTSLIVEDGRVVGVTYLHGKRDLTGQIAHTESKELRGDAVILATGGYSRSEELLRKYTPALIDLPTTNGAFAEGEGIKVAEPLNASLIHMDQVQIHPTSFIMPRDPLQKTKFLAPEALRGLGGVLINHEGKRFVNELDTRDKVTAAIFKNCKPMKVEQEVDGVKTEVDGPVLAYLVMIDEAVKAFPNLRFYSGKGYVSAYSQISELAEGIKVPEKNLRAALNAFNECYNRQGNCNDPFGRTDFAYPTRDSDMFHVMMVTPAIHYTMGGLEIDSEAHVLRAVAPSAGQEEGAKEEKEVIPGLFAAGEVTGGVHGGNRLAGNSLLECVVFGRIAGRAAAAVPTAPTTAAAAAATEVQKEAEEAEVVPPSAPVL
jgi:flavocytochrome c